MIYFDHNAASPLAREAGEAWMRAAAEFPGNPSSPHRLGSRAEAALNQARLAAAGLLGCDPLDLVFTSGATESNNAVLRHAAVHSSGEIWISAIEHPSVLGPARHIFQERLHLIPVSAEGLVDLGWIEERLKERRPGLIGVMAANNETGVIQPWREALALARAHEVPFFCDATQAIGKTPCPGLGECDFVSGSAHKLGGPRGTGFLKCPSSGPFEPLLRGGAQEEGRRAGTENVPGILGMIAAWEARQRQMSERRHEPLLEAKHRFEERLAQILPDAEVISPGAPRLWNTTAALMPAVDCRQRWVVKLDKLGFAVSTGSACASGKEEPSHVLRAMGFTPEQAGRALRFSAGWETQPEDWDLLAEALAKVHHGFQRIED